MDWTLHQNIVWDGQQDWTLCQYWTGSKTTRMLTTSARMEIQSHLSWTQWTSSRTCQIPAREGSPQQEPSCLLLAVASKWKKTPARTCNIALWPHWYYKWNIDQWELCQQKQSWIPFITCWSFQIMGIILYCFELCLLISVTSI